MERCAIGCGWTSCLDGLLMTTRSHWVDGLWRRMRMRTRGSSLWTGSVWSRSCTNNRLWTSGKARGLHISGCYRRFYILIFCKPKLGMGSFDIMFVQSILQRGRCLVETKVSLIQSWKVVENRRTMEVSLLSEVERRRLVPKLTIPQFVSKMPCRSFHGIRNARL
jgi:hypothetical protein